jgi:hypothetical protein
MRRHRASEIAGQKDRPEDRGRRDRIHNGADERDCAEASRQTFARAIAHPVHRFSDNRPGHQLDGAVEQHEYDDNAAENAPQPTRRSGDRHGLGIRRRGPVDNFKILRGHLSFPLTQLHALETNGRNANRQMSNYFFKFLSAPCPPAQRTSCVRGVPISVANLPATQFTLAHGNDGVRSAT